MNYRNSECTLPFSMLTPTSKGVLFIFLCIANVALTYLFFMAPWFLDFGSLENASFEYYLTFVIFANFALISIYVLCFFIGTFLPNNMHIKFIFGILFYLSIFAIFCKISLLESEYHYQAFTDAGPIPISEMNKIPDMIVLSILRVIILPMLLISNLAFMRGQKISSHPFKFEMKKEILIALGMSFSFVMISTVIKIIFQ